MIQILFNGVKNFMDKCKECGMPIEDTDRCSCDPELCQYCCQCEEGCKCGCK